VTACLSSQACAEWVFIVKISANGPGVAILVHSSGVITDRTVDAIPILYIHIFALLILGTHKFPTRAYDFADNSIVYNSVAPRDGGRTTSEALAHGSRKNRGTNFACQRSRSHHLTRF
jgi:hypothetical protein